MSVLNGGAWAGAETAWVYNTAGLSGVVGALEDSALPNDALFVGGNSLTYDAGLALWSGPSTAGAGDAGANSNAPPLVTLTSPASNATVSGLVTLAATVTSPAGAPAIASVTIYVEDFNGLNGSQYPFTAPPYVATWDTTQLPNEGFELTVVVTDAAGATWTDVSVTVNNPSTGPGTTSTGTATGTTTAGSTSGAASSSGPGATVSAGTGTSRTTGTSTTAGSTGSTGQAATGSSTGGGSTTSGARGTTNTAASSTGGPASTPSPGGCGCTAGSGSPMALLPMLALAGWVRRRRRARS